MKEIFSEQFLQKFDPAITQILKKLRDFSFGNIEQRQVFAHLIVGLITSKDPRARKTIKRLGDILSDIGDELLKMDQPIKYKMPVRKEKIIKPYKKIF